MQTYHELAAVKTGPQLSTPVSKQLSQLFDPLANNPAEQLTQLVDPRGKIEIAPGLQGLHSVTPVVEEKVLSGQEVQLEASIPENWPGKHDQHGDEEPSGDEVPLRQAIHIPLVSPYPARLIFNRISCDRRT